MKALNTALANEYDCHHYKARIYPDTGFFLFSAYCPSLNENILTNKKSVYKIVLALIGDEC